MIDIDREWREHATQLANMLALPDSRWHTPVASTARHVFVPRWFERHPDGGWQVRDGADDPDRWAKTPYFQTASVITKIGLHHADHTETGAIVQGRQTSSATNPWLALQMYRAARIHAGCGQVLDVGTGSGCGCALLAALMGSEHVTTVDVDPYLTQAAAERIRTLGHHPRVITADATGSLDWEGDRIVAMVAVPTIPAGWLTALKPGGRLAVNLAGTWITITAKKMADGSAWGRVEFDRGGFMHTRGPDDFPLSRVAEVFRTAYDSDGDRRTSLFPVVDVGNAPELSSVLSLMVPGVEWQYETSADGWVTGYLAHPDGSWARAEGQRGTPATIHQGGQRQLWDTVDRIRSDWLSTGYLRLFGAEVRIQPDGETRFTSGPWSVTLPTADQPPTS